jgi:hypothetical protein
LEKKRSTVPTNWSWSSLNSAVAMPPWRSRRTTTNRADSSIAAETSSYLGKVGANLRGRLRRRKNEHNLFPFVVAYLFLEVWPARQARNAAAACSRSSALLNLRRGFFGGSATSGILPLISSTPCRRIRLRLAICDQFIRPAIKRTFSQHARSRQSCREVTKPAASQTMPTI